jgi:uncharacterized membrane protein (DUF4010 family)
MPLGMEIKPANGLKRKALIFLSLLGLAFGFSQVTQYWITKDAPFLFQMVDAAKQSTQVARRLGEVSSWTTEYNEHDLARDTLPFKVVLSGANSALTIRGLAVKRNDEWVAVKMDSTYAQRAEME